MINSPYLKTLQCCDRYHIPPLQALHKILRHLYHIKTFASLDTTITCIILPANRRVLLHISHPYVQGGFLAALFCF